APHELETIAAQGIPQRDDRAQLDATLLMGSSPPGVDLTRVSLLDRGFDERYEDMQLLGEGGMGEVRLCRDRRIGREVAMKVLRPGTGSRSDARARFEPAARRAARLWGQLEPRRVVPIYDLGIRPAGAAFFTMKRLRGKTLAQVLESLRA